MTQKTRIPPKIKTRKKAKRRKKEVEKIKQPSQWSVVDDYNENED